MLYSVVTEMKTPVLEGSVRLYSTSLTLPDGSVVAAAQVFDILVWSLDEDYAIINARNGQSVKNANGGTLTDGTFTLQLSNLDTVRKSNDISRIQTRYLHFEFQMVGGLVHRHEVLWYVALDHKTA
jgi:hypothetical protein